ncbi:hypothetical protein Pelo_8020 [Pelomyxa schiedti]|nr:hypothetical protein Pelo_8020 [Pelomyxa schiedti]
MEPYLGTILACNSSKLEAGSTNSKENIQTNHCNEWTASQQLQNELASHFKLGNTISPISVPQESLVLSEVRRRTATILDLPKGFRHTEHFLSMVARIASHTNLNKFLCNQAAFTQACHQQQLYSGQHSIFCTANHWSDTLETLSGTPL